MDKFESELKMQELNNQRDLVNAIKDLVVVNALAIKASKLMPGEQQDLDDIISRNMK